MRDTAVLLLLLLLLCQFDLSRSLSGASVEQQEQQEEQVCFSEDSCVEKSQQETRRTNDHVNSFVAIQKNDLEPLELSQIQWEQSKKPVAKYMYEIGLAEQLTTTLLEYSNSIGITKAFRHLLFEGNSLERGAKVLTRFGGHNWEIYRPKLEGTSGMHWISPSDEPAHENYLRVLSKGGFDRILQKIGETFQLEGLYCYSVSFLGLSRATKGPIQHDIEHSGGKAFQISIPLILPDTAEPELELFDEDELDVTGGFKYHHGAASVFGDNVSYGNTACDYRSDGEMRVIAIIYVADIEDTSDARRLLKHSWRAYPSRKIPSHLYNRRHRHWHSLKKERKLPIPLLPFDPLGERLNSGEVLRMSWGDQEVHADMTFEIGLPEKLQTTINQYIRDMGMLDVFKDILAEGNQYDVGEGEGVRFGVYDWVAGRPNAEWKTDEHVLVPEDEVAHNDFLHMLSEGGFDEVINGIGRHFSVKELAVYQVALFGLSYYSRTRRHWDEELSGNRVFQVLVPVYQPVGAGPNLEILQEKFDEEYISQYKFEDDTGVLVGYGTRFGIPACDYRNQKEFSIYARIFVGLIDEDNIEGIVESLSQDFPTHDDTEFLLSAKHWSQSDDSLELPTRPVHGDSMG